MGLDVYVEHCKNYQEATELERLYEKRSNSIWDEYPGEYETLTDEQKEEAREKISALEIELGLSKWGSHPGKTKIEVDSEKHPDHLFKVGYFRSSYNDGGINNVLGRLGFPTLYDIFPHEKEDYEFFPNWKESLEFVINLRDSYKSHLESDSGKFDVMTVDHNMFTDLKEFVDSEEKAFALFEAELKKQGGKASTCYGMKDGIFYFEPLEVVAIISGTKEGIIQKMFTGESVPVPCQYVIYKKSDDTLDWYLQALEIVIETIEWVLEQEDIENYYLVWSS